MFTIHLFQFPEKNAFYLFLYILFITHSQQKKKNKNKLSKRVKHVSSRASIAIPFELNFAISQTGRESDSSAINTQERTRNTHTHFIGHHKSLLSFLGWVEMGWLVRANGLRQGHAHPEEKPSVAP